MLDNCMANTRLALSRLSKSAPQTCPQRDQRLCAAHVHKRCTGWAFPHTTLVLRQVFPHTPFENELAGIQTATKHVRMRPQINQGAHQPIDQSLRRTFSHFKWFLSTVLTTRLALTRLSKSAPQTCPQRDQRRWCCSRSQKMYRVGVSAHNPGTPAGVSTHAFRK